MLLFSSHKRKRNYHRIDVELPTKEKNLKIPSQNRHSSSQLQVQNRKMYTYAFYLIYPVKE